MSGIFYKNRPYAGGGGAGGASALSDLTDTSISSPTNGQVLKYNNGFWENDDESGGTTVVANPTGTASTQLNKLQVGNDIYSIPSGGGGSYSESVLYSNSGTSRQNIGLSDDYTNYDQLYFECIRIADGRNYVVPYYMPVSSLASTGCFQFFGYNEYASYDVSNATTFTLINGGGDWYIKQVVGIKY